jgi:SWI/SNF-related matrix-associated actin-dependent regulator 1 of chromatin subfamily A
MKGVIEWIKIFLESGEKLVVFCTHLSVMDALMNEFKTAVKIDGSVSNANRQKAVDEFQNNPDVNLFIGNSAAESGMTLTAASNLIHIELPWSPSSVSQRNDRCHRIGQKNSVNIHFLLASETIEERIAKLLDKKRIEIDGTMDGIDTPDENLLVALMETYK